MNEFFEDVSGRDEIIGPLPYVLASDEDVKCDKIKRDVQVKTLGKKTKLKKEKRRK